MIRIHFTYKHVDKPWGGANNFIRALRSQLQSSGQFELTDDIEAPCDVLFMNQLGTGPGGAGAQRTIGLAQVRRLTQHGRKLVVRAVNLNRHAFPIGPRNLTVGWWRDRQTISLLNMADMAIFQSQYQLEFFRRAGYAGRQHVVIHNGAPPDFWVERPDRPSTVGNLRFISSTASPRRSKRHDLIARLADCEGVEVWHLGAWPQGLDTGKVRLLGLLTREEMMLAMAQCHYFLHPAVKDICPNAVFEAICAGLPVIYNDEPGCSAEVVGQCGIALCQTDLQATVAQARERYATLASVVLDVRHRYAIDHAAARYRQIFEAQAAGNNMRSEAA